MRRMILPFSVIVLACGGLGTEGEDGTAASRCVGDWRAVDFWQGEYPGPVVHVRNPVSLPARSTPCDQDASTTCTVPPGVYHPWGDHKHGFATIRPIERFRARRAVTLENAGRSVAAGQEVEMTTYLSEGFCMWSIDGEAFDEYCPGMIADDQGDVFEALNPTVRDAPQPQLFLASCTQGASAWIEVGDNFFDGDNLVEGSVIEYGVAGPAQ